MLNGYLYHTGNIYVHVYDAVYTNVKEKGCFLLTFVYALAARSVWPHAVSMTTKCH